MHWFAIVILTAVMVGLQTVLAPQMEVLGARPDWLLVFVVFLGLYASPQRSVIAAWFVGICADLNSIERIGVLSLSYAAAALLLVAVRDHVFRYSVLTQFAVTFILGVLVQAAWLVYARVLYGWDGAVVVQVLFAAVYTALWAPFAHTAILHVAGVLGVPRPRPGRMGVAALDYTDV